MEAHGLFTCLSRDVPIPSYGSVCVLRICPLNLRLHESRDKTAVDLSSKLNRFQRESTVVTVQSCNVKRVLFLTRFLASYFFH